MFRIIGFQDDNHWLEIGEEVQVDLDLVGGVVNDLSALMNLSKGGDSSVVALNDVGKKSEFPAPTSE